MNRTTRVFLRSLGFTKKVRFIFMRVLDMLKERLGRKKHFSSTYSFFNQLLVHGVSLVDSKQRYCLGYQGKTFLIRKYSSDEQVFTDVVLNEEYGPVMDLADSLNIDVRSIIDAGANVGLTTMVLASRFPKAEIVSLEPDKENFQLLADNVQLSLLSQVKPLQAGLSQKDGWLVPAPALDDREWAKAFRYASEVSGPAVVAYSVPSIVNLMGWSGVDLLKIDIEGGEKEIFMGDDTDFFFRVKLLAVEIHDKGEKVFINEQLKTKGFICFEHFDLTIAVNSNCIKQ